ncbi:MAG: DUF2141 domain-containing protein [Bradymonadaceae bacterium]|nr:DUF2141 domain-containing protein [Lujinxingiaceae bacterium]
MSLHPRFLPLGLFCALLIFWPPTTASGESTGDPRGTLVVNVSGLRSDTGMVRAGLFTSNKSFPLGVDSLENLIEAPIRESGARLTFPDLPYGTYSVVVYHDEDANGSLNRNWIGKPTEGVGVYKPVTSRFPPPKFKDCKFDLNQRQMTVAITMNYL